MIRGAVEKERLMVQDHFITVPHSPLSVTRYIRSMMRTAPRLGWAGSA